MVPRVVAVLFLAGTTAQYTVTLTSHSSVPVISSANAAGSGQSHCDMAFNPSYIPASPSSPTAGLLVRLCCDDTCMGHGLKPNTLASDGLPAERIGFAPCDLKSGVCSDTLPDFNLDPSTSAEDPRAFLFGEFYYNFYYSGSSNDTAGPPCEGDQCTVKLAKTRTPLNASSWEPVALLPWHRNGCCIRKPVGEKSYCVWGEGPDPLPGLGISYTMDINSGVFVQTPWQAPAPSHLSNDSMWLLPLGSDQDEIKLEAGSHPVELSTGDWLHFYAAATPGWVENGNYTVGWVVLDKDYPSTIIQRSVEHIMVPTFQYETLCNGTTPCPYVGERARVIFMCSADRIATDEFRLFFGGGDGNVGTAVVTVAVDRRRNSAATPAASGFGSFVG